MKSLDLGPIALSMGAAAAMLSACGGSQPPIRPPNGAVDFGHAPSHHRTFHYTGKRQSFVVPSGVTQITVAASGASGPHGEISSSCRLIGGLGGLVQATIPVTPGEKLAVSVGGVGTIGAGCGSESGYGTGGFNGGGNGGPSSYGGGPGYNNGDGGGGASDVRQRGSGLEDRVVVAAGGGGAGGYAYNDGAGGGGAGGGRIGGRGSGQSGSGWCLGHGGKGGTQKKGGKGGRGGPYGYSHGTRGKRGAAGQGGSGGGGEYDGAGGGGGGGGYYGGGGGGSGMQCTSSVGAGGGGGGGASYVEPGATNVKDQQGTAPPGNGQVIISW